MRAWRRALSILLTLTLCAGLMPLGAWAGEEEAPDAAQAEIEEAEIEEYTDTEAPPEETPEAAPETETPADTDEPEAAAETEAPAEAEEISEPEPPAETEAPIESERPAEEEEEEETILVPATEETADSEAEEPTQDGADDIVYIYSTAEFNALTGKEHCVLMNDLYDPKPIHTWSGILDGNGHTIYNVSRLHDGIWNSQTWSSSNFPYIYGWQGWISKNAGEIRNIIFSNVDLESLQDLPTDYEIRNGVMQGNNRDAYWGLIGQNVGVIENCIIDSGTLALRLTNGICVGGFVGYNTESGIIRNCVNKSSVYGGSFTFVSRAPGETYRAYSYASVGGIVGTNAGTIEQCLNMGSVTVEWVLTIDTDDAAEHTDIRFSAGGIVGSYSGTTVTGCANTGNLITSDAAGEISGDTLPGIGYSNCYSIRENSDGITKVTMDDIKRMWPQAFGSPLVELPQEPVCTISFDPNGGAGIMFDLERKSGETYGIMPSPYRDGYNFFGWYTAPEGGDKITSDTVVSLDEDQTLYAHWMAGYYGVTLDANGGNFGYKPIMGAYETTWLTGYFGYATYGELPEPTRSGAQFEGWYTAAEGGTKITADTVIQFKEHTLYAHWIPVYTLRFDANGGNVDAPSQKIFTQKTFGDLPIPYRMGYSFIGWFTEAEGGERITSDTETECGGSYTLYAHWNRASIDYWSFANVKDDFHSPNEYYTNEEDKSRLLKNLTEAERELIDESYHDEWNGSCYGMSIWVILCQQGILAPSDISGLSKLADYSCNEKIQSAINFYQVQTSTNIWMNAKYTFMKQSVAEKLAKLEEMAKSENLIQISFAWEAMYDTNGNRIKSSGGAHTIVGYGLETGNFTETVFEYLKNVKWNNQTYNRTKAQEDSPIFNKRIKIYDPANPNSGDRYYLYFSDYGDWCIPGWGVIGREEKSFSYKNNGTLMLCTTDTSLENIVDFRTGATDKALSEAIIRTERINLILELDRWRYEIDGLRVLHAEGAPDIITAYEPNITTDGVISKKVLEIFPSSTDRATVSSQSDDNLDFKYLLGDQLTSIWTGVSGVATVGAGYGAVKLDEEDMATIRFTTDNGCAGTEWNTVEVFGGDVTELAAEVGDDGLLIHGDNLDWLEITGLGDEDDDEWHGIFVSTEADSVLVHEEDGTLVAFVDTDGNGSYETQLDTDNDWENDYLLGDVNEDGAVDRKDRIYLARHLAGWAGYDLTGAARAAADVNEDGGVDRKDRIYLARYLAGWAGYDL